MRQHGSLLAVMLCVVFAAVLPERSGGQARPAPVTGDWLLAHILSDPEQLNPLTSNDAGSSAILGYIVQSLLTRDPRSLELNRYSLKRVRLFLPINSPILLKSAAMLTSKTVESLPAKMFCSVSKRSNVL
jgi:hypothetical protein